MDTTANRSKTVDVTVRTPAGHAHEFTFKADARVSKATRESLTHFVGTSQLAEGDYGLALTRDGRTVELAPGARLDDHDIEDGETLALYPKQPQVDGNCALAA